MSNSNVIRHTIKLDDNDEATLQYLLDEMCGKSIPQVFSLALRRLHDDWENADDGHKLAMLKVEKQRADE